MPKDQDSHSKEVFEVPVDEIEEHPGHEGIADMGDEKFDGLVESVRQEGIRQPVELLSEEEAEARNEPENVGTLLDGRQRVRAAREAGLESVPATYATIPDHLAVTEYIYKQAGERRDLNKSQRAILAVQLKNQIEQELGQGARTDTSGINSRGEGQTSRDRAGQVFGVSGRYITTAEKLLDNAPDLADQVRNGHKTLTQGIREYNRRAGNQEKPSAFQRSRTMFRRFKNSFSKVRSSNELPPEQYQEARELLQRLEELLETEETGEDEGRD